MKALALLSILLVGCTVPYHFKQIQKHQFKAISKGATIERGTITKTVTKSDTITVVDTVDNVVTITHTIRDTVYLEGLTKYIYKTRTETRQENKTERKKAKFKNNHDKKKLKVETDYLEKMLKTELEAIKIQEKTKRKEKRSSKPYRNNRSGRNIHVKHWPCTRR